MRRNAIAWVGLLACTSAGCSFIDDFDKFKKGDASSVEPPPGHDDGGTTDDDMDAQTPPPSDDAGSTTRDGGKSERDGGKVERDGGDVVTADAGTQSDAGDAATGRCGDGHLDSGEQCDDGNTIAGDGCEPNTCTRTPPAVCNGKSCDDSDVCTVDQCDAKTGACTNRAIDADNDGFSPGKCKGGTGIEGGDCNDANAAINPDAKEICDGIDNDCDGVIDNGLTKLHCYPDVDGDGFANLSAKSAEQCVCPVGTLSVSNPSDTTASDCYDVADADGPNVNPNQTLYFDHGYGSGAMQDRSFDYNCNTKLEPEYAAYGTDTCPGLIGVALCAQAEGYVAKAAPACGASGSYLMCPGNAVLGACSGTTAARVQACR